jgi:hypothetical protein
MTRGVGRAGSTGLLAALAAIVWLALFYGLNPDLVVDFDTAPPSLLTGVYPNVPSAGRSPPCSRSRGEAAKLDTSNVGNWLHETSNARRWLPM